MPDFFTVYDLAKYFDVNPKTHISTLMGERNTSLEGGEELENCEERY